MHSDADRLGANACFLHGLESTSGGTKGRWLAERFPAIRMRDYRGGLPERLDQLVDHVAGLDELILIGSSFGGLMAASFAEIRPARCRRLVLLAPALNFPDYRPPAEPLDVETFVLLGAHDALCSPDQVEPVARAVFRNVEIQVADEDHLLRRSFPQLDWARLLA